LIFAATLTTSASAADARKDETLAKRWCATCHVVAADQQVGTTQSPAFATIARNPEFNEDAGSVKRTRADAKEEIIEKVVRPTFGELADNKRSP
jgi:hypothetical protein